MTKIPAKYPSRDFCLGTTAMDILSLYSPKTKRGGALTLGRK